MPEEIKQRTNWDGVGAITGIVSAITALVAVVVTLVVANQSDTAARESALRAERVDAYASYVRVHARFNEFLWGHLYHAGTDVGTKPDEDPAFWPTAIEIATELESTNLQARMLAHGTAVEELLTAMHDSEQAVFNEFKCLSGLTCADPDTNPGTNSDIEELLASWSEDATAQKKSLIAHAADQLQ